MLAPVQLAGLIAHADSLVSISFQPFLSGCVCCSGEVMSSACLIPSQGHSLLMHFFCNLHHVPSSTSPNCITMTSSVIFICFSLCFMSQIYSTELPIDWGSLSHSLEPFSCVLYVYVFAYVYVCVRRCCEYFNQSEVQLQT